MDGNYSAICNKLWVAPSNLFGGVVYEPVLVPKTPLLQIAELLQWI